MCVVCVTGAGEVAFSKKKAYRKRASLLTKEMASFMFALCLSTIYSAVVKNEFCEIFVAGRPENIDRTERFV